jgi:hypothetical protein
MAYKSRPVSLRDVIGNYYVKTITSLSVGLLPCQLPRIAAILSPLPPFYPRLGSHIPTDGATNVPFRMRHEGFLLRIQKIQDMRLSYTSLFEPIASLHSQHLRFQHVVLDPK